MYAKHESSPQFGIVPAVTGLVMHVRCMTSLKPGAMKWTKRISTAPYG